MADAKPSRMPSILSVVVYVACGIPIWWTMTQIQRPELPHARMQQAPVTMHGMQLPVSLALHMPVPEGNFRWSLAPTAAPTTGPHVGCSIQEGDAEELSKGFWEVFTTHLDEASKGAVSVHVAFDHCGQHASSSSPLTGDGAPDGGSGNDGLEPGAEGECRPECGTSSSSKGRAACPSYPAGSNQEQLGRPWRDRLLRHDQEYEYRDEPGVYHVLLSEAAASNTLAADDTGWLGEEPLELPALRVLIGSHRMAMVEVSPLQGAPGGARGSSGARLARLVGALKAAAPALADAFLVNVGAFALGLQKLPQQLPQCCAKPFTDHLATRAASAHRQEQQLPVSAAGDLLLSFSLCNAEPDRSYHSWEFEPFEERYLEPIKEALSPVIHVSVESQVLLYTRSKVNGSWSEAHDAYLLKQSRLPSFVDTHWSLNAGGAPYRGGSSRRFDVDPMTTAGIPQHVLDFVVYLPPPGQRPLRVSVPAAAEADVCGAGQGAGGCRTGRGTGRDGSRGGPGTARMSLSPTNSFWMPSWGVVHILNPPCVDAPPSAAVPSIQGSGSAQPSRNLLIGEQEMSGLARAAVSGLRALLGADFRERLLRRYGGPLQEPAPGSGDAAAAGVGKGTRGSVNGRAEGGDGGKDADGLTIGGIDGSEGAKGGRRAFELTVEAAQETGFSGWEVDALMRRRAAENVASAAQVLDSLSRLVEQLPSLEMPDLIGAQVEAALLALDLVVEAARAGDYAAACDAAQSARSSAEAAFSNPAVLARLSYPPSHLLGVYVPLFLPVAMSVLQVLVLEVKRRRGARSGRPVAEYGAEVALGGP